MTSGGKRDVDAAPGEDGSDDERKLSGDDDLPEAVCRLEEGIPRRGPKYKRGRPE
jgi:hypothetical protein